MNNEVTTKIPPSDGWSDTENDDRIIQGTLVRCVDGHWSDKDGANLPKQLLALSTITVFQCWRDQKPIETITDLPLPDLDELNAKIPQDEWELGIDSKPAGIAEMERQLGLNEDVLRFMTIRIDAIDEAPSAILSRKSDDRERGFRGPKPAGRFESGRKRGYDDREEFRAREETRDEFRGGRDAGVEE